MKEIILLTIITGLVFLIFVLTLTFGIINKSNKLKQISVLVFIVFACLTGWTSFKFITKSYNKIARVFGPRTGDEIYDVLFDKRQTHCVKVLNHKDQVVPKLDIAIWLHFETCPEELKRILSRYNFTAAKVATGNWDGKIPHGEVLGWFNPKTLGDTIMVYEYTSSDYRNIQTIWVSLDSTKAFCRDIFD